ncbi:hypothetical protein Rhopal_007175-T1 [Rhodotorula paludigena]|uniref:Uncharacterized protein n=1 Tax=Rhodotorula paludigena TaxID=86838 RepID=A0AAV5GP24_9BASI|nr:hypothetical protein Rhopal_007175-T1 [Rhodotorula paludigena]
MAPKDKVAETHALPQLGEALEQALSLREPDERHHEVDPAGAADQQIQSRPQACYPAVPVCDDNDVG